MKRIAKKSKGIVKGAPSGLVISLLVHATAFMLAGLLVVFTAHQKEEKKFVPPKAVERPRMNLKKPKVKVKKTAKPKPTTRIVTKVKRASMPDIQLPEMTGMSDGLAGGIGGFEIMPDFSETTIFGSGQTIGNDFIGTFYDFKRDRSGRATIMDPEKFVDILADFVRQDWKPSKLARFYRSPKKLYATSFMIPTLRSSVAPTAFGEDDTGGWCWAAHYKGQLVHKDGLTFRFRGQGDDICTVRVDGEVVLAGNIPDNYITAIGSFWQSSSADSRKYIMGGRGAVVGDWITLEPDVPLPMEVLIGEVPGGSFSAMLAVEVQGEEYERNAQGGPILPMFMTQKPSWDLQDRILEWLITGEACVTSGPVFSDFGSSVSSNKANKPDTPEPIDATVESVTATTRLWTHQDGETMEARFVNVVGVNAILENARGKQVRIPVAQLAADDREYIELARPPELKITFTKKSSQRFIETSPFLEENPPRILDYVFGVKLDRKGSRSYPHEITVEYVAVGQQYLDDQKYYLLERREQVFNLAGEGREQFFFKGEPVELTSFDLQEQIRGKKYAEYVVVVRDKRGEIIAHSSSCSWLFENLEQLNTLPAGVFMDKTCTRVYPTGPKRTY